MKKTIAILRGGPSAEHDVSLATGAGMLEHIDRTAYDVRDIIITRDGVWTVDGEEQMPEDVLRGVDAVLIALHGTYGEDGQVQALLDQLEMPYAGTGAQASAICMNKALTLLAAQKILPESVVTARHRIIAPDVWKASANDVIDNITHYVGFPCVVKPAIGGSSIGVSIIRSATEAENEHYLRVAIDDLAGGESDIIVEQFVAGREVTCAVVEGMGDETITALPLVEVVLSDDQEFFDYDAKYGGKTTEICPAQIDDMTCAAICEASIALHRQLGLRDYSRSDFIIADDGCIYFLETNTLPGMTPTSFVPQALAAADISYTDFLTHLIERTLHR